MKIKTLVSYYLTSVRMAIIKKSTNNICWRGCGEKGTLIHCQWKCTLVLALQKTVWRFLKKLRVKKKKKLKELPYDPAIPHLDIYLDKTIIQSYMHLYVHSRTSHNSQRHENNPNVHWQMSRQRSGKYIQWSTAHP